MSINIHKDSRNRGLEVLLYHPEKKSEVLNNDRNTFKINLKIPLFFKREFNLNLEVFLDNKSKNTEKN